MIRSPLLRRAWAVVEFLAQIALLAAVLFAGIAFVYVFFGGAP